MSAPGIQIPGLPEPLPAGEEILWRGTSRWTSLAAGLFHLKLLAVYFAGLAIAGAGFKLAAGDSAAQAALVALWLLALGAAALAVLATLAWLIGRTTLYAITTRRIVMRIGVAIPMTINIPFSIIESAGLRVRADGTGDIPLRLGGREQLAYFHLWPHARPWRIARAEPMLRAVPDAAHVAAVLAHALGTSPAPIAGAARVPRTTRARAVSSHAREARVS